MPSIRQHHSAQFTKGMILGDSGVGKTGALLSLAEAGYKLRIIDVDNGLDILANLANASTKRAPNGTHPADNIEYVTVSDSFKSSAGKILPVATANSWTRTVNLLEGWNNKARNKVLEAAKLPLEEPYDLGKPADWGEDCILGIDSLTFLSKAALRYVLKLNGREMGPTYESDWGDAQKLIELLLGMIYAEDFKTNVLVLTHISYRDFNGMPKAFPMSIGKALNPQIGRYFNTMLEVSRTGTGAGVKREIHTVPHGLLDLKNPNPIKVKATYPIQTGLAEIFAAIRPAPSSPEGKVTEPSAPAVLLNPKETTNA